MQRLKLLFSVFLMACACTAFAKKGGGPATLENTYWKLAEVSGKPITTPTDAREAFLTLISKKSRVQGNTGCNSLAGKYEMGRHGFIKFTVASTKMACADMSTENYMQSALSGANRYVINGQNLLLYNDNLLLAIFEARDEKAGETKSE